MGSNTVEVIVGPSKATKDLAVTLQSVETTHRPWAVRTLPRRQSLTHSKHI